MQNSWQLHSHRGHWALRVCTPSSLLCERWESAWGAHAPAHMHTAPQGHRLLHAGAVDARAVHATGHDNQIVLIQAGISVEEHNQILHWQYVEHLVYQNTTSTEERQIYSCKRPWVGRTEGHTLFPALAMALLLANASCSLSAGGPALTGSTGHQWMAPKRMSSLVKS